MAVFFVILDRKNQKNAFVIDIVYLDNIYIFAFFIL